MIEISHTSYPHCRNMLRLLQKSLHVYTHRNIFLKGKLGSKIKIHTTAYFSVNTILTFHVLKLLQVKVLWTNWLYVSYNLNFLEISACLWYWNVCMALVILSSYKSRNPFYMIKTFCLNTFWLNDIWTFSFTYQSTTHYQYPNCHSALYFVLSSFCYTSIKILNFL